MNTYEILNSQEEPYKIKLEADSFFVDEEGDLFLKIGSEDVALFTKDAWSAIYKIFPSIK